jgi:phage terminase small subunit
MVMKPPTIKPPSTLSRHSADLWTQLRVEHGLTDAVSLTMLENALTCLDRAMEAEAVLKKEGLIVRSRSGFQRPHPCVAMARAARADFMRTLRALDLDAAPPPKIGRPAFQPMASDPLRKIGSIHGR